MPKLHVSDVDGHHYVRTILSGKQTTLQLTSEGVAYLTGPRGLRLRDGDSFEPDLLDLLLERRWAYSGGDGPGPTIDDPGGGSGSGSTTRGPSTGNEPPVAPSPRPVPTAPPTVSIRLEAHDHTILDQSARDILEAVRQTGAAVLGPLPLPTRVERYAVLHGPISRAFEIRTHKRFIHITEPSNKTIEALHKLSLPTGLNITIKASPGST